MYSPQRYELIIKKIAQQIVMSDFALWKSGQSTVGPVTSFSNSL